MMHTLLKIYVISVLDLIAVGTFFPLFVPHLRQLGLFHTQIGFLMSAYSILQIVFGPIMGSFSDKINRKYVLMVILFACSACYMALQWTTTFCSILIVRVLLGIGKHTQSVCKSIVLDLIPASVERTQTLSRLTGLSTCGFVIGPLIGGYLIELPNGYLWVCSMTSILLLMNLGISMTLPNICSQSPKIKTNAEVIRAKANDYRSTTRRLSMLPAVMRLAFALTISYFFYNQSLYLGERFALSQRYTSYMISYISAISAATSFLPYARVQVLGGFVVSVVVLIALQVANDIKLVLLLYAIMGLLNGSMRVVTMELILNENPQLGRGFISGAANSIMAGGRLAVPLISGIVNDAGGQKYIMAFASIPAILGIVLSAIWTKYRRHSKLD